MRNKITLALAVAFLAFLPGMAAAQGVVSPQGGNAWDLFVFGNGRVIYDVLMAIKLFMIPDSGDTGYRSLLILVATIGFLLLAIQAGFDPARNLMKMFTFVFVAWGVFFASTKLTANITVNDRVTGYVNTVERVPFVVGVPASLVSQIGDYFTRSIETYFAYPAELKMTGTSVGQFNLFGRMIEESSQYTLTDAHLRNTLRAYMADCVVPAIASGKFKGTKTNGAGDLEEVAGVDALLNSSNLVQTLQSAQHNALLTKYFPMTGGKTSGSAYKEISEAKAVLPEGVSEEYVQGQGILVSCTGAYSAMKEDIEQNAQALMDKSSEAWAKTGVQVPLESVHNAVIGAVGLGGGNQYAQYGSPNTYVQQQAMINLMGGSFRQIAAQTGNNEALTASLVSMAEQQQKSAWGSAFVVFNNMMGYVYTVLQAFIFAISPLIIVAMLIPGMGGAIVANYAQILVWLMLWQPMLSVINFLITLFGADQIAGAWASTGGPSMANRAVVSEKTNDLMLAAQFLGTMTPLITWGIVKGAMAFTEFIQKGVGSDLAAQAGQGAAAGNLSMATIGMGNTNMGTHSTAASASVGFKSTTGYFGAGAADVMQSGGGTTAQANGANMNAVQKLSEGYSQQQQMTQSASRALNQMMSQGVSSEEAIRNNFSKEDSAGQSYARSLLNSSGFSAQTGVSGSSRASAGNSASTGERTSNTEANVDSVGLSGSLGLKGGGSGVGASMGTTDQDTTSRGTDSGSQTSVDSNNSVSRDSSMTNSSRRENTSTSSSNSGHSASHGVSASSGYSASQQAALSRAMAANDAYAETVSRSMSAESSVSHSQATDMAYANSQMASWGAQRDAIMGQLASGASFASGVRDSTSGAAGISGPSVSASDVSSQVGAVQGSVSSQLSSIGGASRGGVNGAGQAGAAQQQINTSAAAVGAGAGAVNQGAARDRAANASEDTTRPLW